MRVSVYPASFTACMKENEANHRSLVSQAEQECFGKAVACAAEAFG